MFSDLSQLLAFVISLLLVLTVHEASHALVAYYLGDPTAKLEGRLSLNPVRHLDLFGSIVFLVTWRFGWGKPVPVNPQNFKEPVRDSALTALAGPFSNFVFAFVLALPLKYFPGNVGFVGTLLWTTFHLNIFLGLFNLLPFPPLDGSKIIGILVPRRYHRGYMNYLENGFKYFLVIILVDFVVLPELFGFSFFGYVIGTLHDYVKTVLLLGT